MFTTTRLRRALRRLSHSAGFDIRRWPLPDAAAAQFAQVLHSFGVTVVLDVGANTGQFGKSLRAAGYGGRILSFEPCSAACAVLREKSAGDPSWSVFSEALGDQERQGELTVFNRTDMSSLLPLSEKGRALFPRLAADGVETVSVHRLDRVLPSLIDDQETPALKVDVQGGERAVLAGAGASLSRFAAVQVEAALEPLYDGAPVFEEIQDLLHSHGFRLAMMTPVSFPKAGGPPLEVDALFIH